MVEAVEVAVTSRGLEIACLEVPVVTVEAELEGRPSWDLQAEVTESQEALTLAVAAVAVRAGQQALRFSQEARVEQESSSYVIR